MKSTIRAVSEGSRSGATSPVSQLGSPHLLTPGPLSPALTPSNSLDQVTALNLGLGKFDFEEKLSPIVDRFSVSANRPSSDQGNDPDSKGLTLDSAAALLTAMTADERFAKAASRPSSIALKSGGLYGKDATPGALLPSPLLSLQDVPPRQRETPQLAESELTHSDGFAQRQGEEQISELSTYLNLLAQQTSIRASLPWIEFFGTSGANEKSAGRAVALDDSADLQLEKERQRLDLDKLNSAQRRSMIRKSRSLGEGLLSLFAHGDRHDQPPAMKTPSPGLGALPRPILPEMSLSLPPTDFQIEIEKKATRESSEVPIARSPSISTVPTGATEPTKPPELDADHPSGSRNDAGETHPSETNAHTSPIEASQVAPVTEEMSVQPKRRKQPGRRTTCIDDFELIRVLGKGCAGKVRNIRLSADNAFI